MNLQSLSIKRKLMLITMLTSSIALLLCAISFLTYDLISFRRLLIQDLTTQAEIIGYNSAAAMAFGDEHAAAATLSALTAKEDIVAAVLYSPDGSVFAHYSRSGKPPLVALPSHANQQGYRFQSGYVEVFHDVTLNGERIGTLFLQSDLRQLELRARRYAGIFFVFVLISGLFALLVSTKLQRMISGPILHLEETMKMVSTNKTYEIRATKAYSDEIGGLIDGFNTMLSEIQHRDTALRGANDELKTRTGELEEEVSQRKQAQEELLKAKHAAEEANRAKSAFLANMSHELRTPLNAIIGYSEMLEEETRDAGKTGTAEDLKKIQAAGKHLLALINDVLDLSKIEAGKMGLHLETFDVPEMIQELVTTLQPAIAKNHNTIRMALEGNLGAMRADITKVRQILLNLLSNACKFTEHGSILVEVAQYAAEGQDWIKFRITDTGIGITARQKDHLFEEFAQADTSIARKYGGTGLGLAITYKFVQLMRGRMEVDSQPGEGSTFSVILPAQVRIEAADTAQMLAIASAVDASPRDKAGADTVLVIDDDPAVRDLMTRCLTKAGFSVVCASSGEEGLRLARQCRPLVITLDVMMPDCDGWGTLNKLKADRQLANIPVIMVTIVDNEAMGFDLGAANYLIKPVDRERLAGLIQTYRDTRSHSEGPRADKLGSLANSRKRERDTVGRAGKRG